MKTVGYYYVTYTFRSQTTLNSNMNVKELLAQNMCDIWSLSDSNMIPTHNYTVWIHSENRTWHENNIQPNVPYR